MKLCLKGVEPEKGDSDLLRIKKHFRAICETKIRSNIRSLVDEAYQQGNLVLLCYRVCVFGVEIARDNENTIEIRPCNKAVRNISNQVLCNQ